MYTSRSGSVKKLRVIEASMGITYQQKRQILAFMSDRAHWENVFNMDFFMDERRKWQSSGKKNGITVHTSPDKSSFLIVDENEGGGAITLSRAEDRQLRISDESERIMFLSQEGQNLEIKIEGAGTDVSDMASEKEIGLDEKDARVVVVPELAAYVRFYEDGSKRVFLDDASRKITFDPPLNERSRTLQEGRYFHVVEFDLDSAENWGLSPVSALIGTKLIVSKDLSIEPDIRTFNDLDPQKAQEYLAYLLRDEWDETYSGPWQWRPKKEKQVGDISHLHKHWVDTTEYEGHFVGLPKQFYVRKTAKGFALATSLDNREAIWSQTAILNQTIDGAAKPVQLVRPNLSPRTLLHVLNHGETIEDHRGREWKCAVVETDNTATIANEARTLSRENFGLTACHFSAVNYDRNTCFLAMDAQAHERLTLAYDATVEVLHRFTSGASARRANWENVS